MNKLLATAALAILLSPFAASVAQAGDNDKPRRFKTRATEMVGLTGAVLVSAVGYLAVRRRTRMTK